MGKSVKPKIARSYIQNEITLNFTVKEAWALLRGKSILVRTKIYLSNTHPSIVSTKTTVDGKIISGGHSYRELLP